MDVIAMMIHDCKNSTQNGNRCKPKEEIIAKRKHIKIYFRALKILVDQTVFHDSQAVQEGPWKNDTANYFPVSSKIDIPYQRTLDKVGSSTPWARHYFSFNHLKISESPFALEGIIEWGVRQFDFVSYSR